MKEAQCALLLRKDVLKSVQGRFLEVGDDGPSGQTGGVRMSGLNFRSDDRQQVPVRCFGLVRKHRVNARHGLSQNTRVHRVQLLKYAWHHLEGAVSSPVTTLREVVDG